MKLTVFNGSPRGEKSNTRILLEQFLNGFTQTPGNSFEEHYLIHTTEHLRFAEAFQKSEAVLLAFPLYTDAMPGIVKAFIEELKPKGAPAGNSPTAITKKKILFMVQSGFPEAIHSVAVEKYLIKLARRLECECAGVIVKGGAEGIQSMPAKMTQKLFTQFSMLGAAFGESGKLDENILKVIRGINRFPVFMLPLFYLIKLTGIMDSYWNGKLKENNAFKQRFDRPYAPKVNQKD
jgi:multimeric flavodoxin WrbA